MAIVFFLERFVMTVLEGPITNDQFLACTSVSIITAWRTKALWDWTTFLVFQTRQDVQTLGNWPSAPRKVKTTKTRHVIIRQLILLAFS